MKTVVTDLKLDIKELHPLEKAAEWARQAERKNNWSESAQRWAILRKAYPKHHPMVWFQGAKAHIEANELEQAEKLLEYGRQHFSSNPNAYIISAELAIKRQQWDVAEAFLKQSRERFPDFAQTWLKSAECSEHQGNVEKATEYNKIARECAPDLIAPFVQYAELAMHAQQWEEALERWKLLRTHFPDVPTGYHSAAEAARNLGEHRLARQLMLSLEYGENLFDNENPEKKSPARAKKPAHSDHLLELIWTKAILNLRSEGQRNYFSYVWLAFDPMLHILVYYIVFGLVMRRGGENYLAFLLTGQIPWMWFSKAVSGSSASILAGQNLMLRIGLPSIVFPLINLLKVSLQQIPVFLLLLGFVWMQGFSPDVLWWGIFPIIIVQLLITTAFTCAVAAVIPFARDINYLVPTGLMFLMLGSGIFYDYRVLSIEWQSLFLLNPVAFLLKCYREILIDGVLPDLITLAWWGLGSAVACLLLVHIYRKLRYIYPRIVME